MASISDEEAKATINKKAMISKEEATAIEAENGLELGSFAYDRKASPAEAVYLQVKPLTPLAFHIEPLAGLHHLVILDFPELEDGEENPILGVNSKKTWDPYLGDKDPRVKDPRVKEKVASWWAGLCATRDRGLREQMAEDMSLVITGATLFEGLRYSRNYSGSVIRGVFAQDSRAILLEPEFVELPPEGEGEPSPGLGIQKLRMARIVIAQSVLFQGCTTFANHDAAGILQVADASRPKPN